MLKFTSGPEDWQKLLADPDLHWKTGFSARTLAYSWEEAKGFPSEVRSALSNQQDALLSKLEPLLAIPEFKVPLPGGTRASQNDLFVLARSSAGTVTIMVEGKVKESFGPTLGEWYADASKGKETRLKALLGWLGLSAQPEAGVRYQLLHRAASAIITADQYRAVAAVMLIHSFSQERAGWPDYQAFTALFGVTAAENKVQRLGTASPIPLFGVWVVGNPEYLKR